MAPSPSGSGSSGVTAREASSRHMKTESPSWIFPVEAENSGYKIFFFIAEKGVTAPSIPQYSHKNMAIKSNYRLGTVNSNTVNPKFHLNQSFFISLLCHV